MLTHALFTSDKLFRRFIELANDVVFAMDLQGRLQYVSPKWKELFGSDPEALIGKDYVEVLHPADIAHCAQAVATTLTQRQQLNNIEYRIRHANGNWCHQAANIAPLLDDAGQVLGVVGIGRDISAQKAAEQSLRDSEARYSLLAEYASDVVWTMELDGRISYLSPSIERARGLTVEEAMRQPIHEALAPESVAQVAAYFSKLHQAIANKTPIEPYRGDMLYYRKDGSPYWGEVIATPTFDAEGNFRQLVGVTRDINERKRQQDELKHHREQLEQKVLERTQKLASALDVAEQANRAKSVLLMNVSHELRTPLNHVLGFGSLLKKDVHTDKGQERLDKIMQSASTLLRLIENLLDTARLESNQIQLEGADFELADLLARVVADVQPALQAKSLQMQCHCAPQVSARLHGDAQRIAQVLRELLDNAIKFTDAGQIDLRVSETRSGKRMTTLRFEVQDPGIGIELDAQAAMFQLFIQGDGTVSRRYGGTGLGLALCQRLVNLMAGEIGVESQPGAGSLFWLEIPLSVVDTQAGTPG